MGRSLVDTSAFSRRLVLTLLLPTLVIAYPTISTNGSASIEYHAPLCYPRTSQSPTQQLVPSHCEEAIFRFYTSLPASFTDPIFTRDPDRAKLPNYHLVPREITYRRCTVRVDVCQSRDAAIDMRSFEFQGDRVIEACATGSAFNGGEVVMEGDRPGQAINISIGHPEPQTTAPGKGVTHVPNISALIRRVSHEFHQPNCDRPTKYSPKQVLIPANCEYALYRLWACIPSGTTPIFTRESSKAAALPNYFLAPKREIDEECKLTVSLAPGTIEAAIDIEEIVYQGDRVINVCFSQGPGVYTGGNILVDGKNPKQAIVIRFSNSRPRGVGQTLGNGNGNVTEGFVLPVSSSKR